MRILVTEKLSEHKYKTPEGYLVCVDSILARTGKQRYTRNEIFHDGNDEEIDVDRTEEEVFSDETLASFENKPLTAEHPDEDVTPLNYRDYAVGFVRDIKRGKDGNTPVMLGTLVITDKDAIDAVENGKLTDLSCGYDCDITDEKNPVQKNIRGNHVALCEQGRAGNARVVDSVKDDWTTIEFSGSKEANILEKLCQKYGCKITTRGVGRYRIEGSVDAVKKVSSLMSGYQFTGELEDSIEDMALSRTDAMDRCISLGKKFIQHFDKLYKNKNQANNHWLSEMSAWYDKVKEIKLKENNKEILKGDLRDWFFTAGANPQDFMVNPTYDELKAYDDFIEKILSTNNVKKSYNVDSIQDVEPRSGETKEEFIERFMKETKSEYPDIKQRFAIANSYWERKDSVEDARKVYYIVVTSGGQHVDEKGYLSTNPNSYRYFETEQEAQKAAQEVGKRTNIQPYIEKQIVWEDSVEDGEGILSAGQEAQVKRYCQRYEVDFNKIYKAIKEMNRKYPRMKIDDIIESVLDDVVSGVYDSVEDAYLKLPHKDDEIYAYRDYRGQNIYVEYWGHDRYQVTAERDNFKEKYMTEDEIADYLDEVGARFVKVQHDSVKDKLVEVPENLIRQFENGLKKDGITIVRKGKTFTGRTHYQLKSSLSDIELFRYLQKWDNWFGKYDIPVTYAVSKEYDGSSAGLDIDKQYVKDIDPYAKATGALEKEADNMEELADDFGKKFKTFDSKLDKAIKIAKALHKK